MKIKGQAHITFKDAKTGRIVHEENHTNNLTPALARIFGANIAGTLNYAKLTPVISELLGGVCLFNGTVSADDVFLPKAADAMLTAHAGQTSYTTSGDDPKRGNPLGAPSSGPIPNGFSWVWEWGPTQGNGPITDVVLTHKDTGDFWNESTPNSMSEFCPVADVSNGIISPAAFGWVEQGYLFPHVEGAENIPIAFLDDNNNVVTIEGAEDKIIVHVAKFTGSGAWIWNECGEIKDSYTIDFYPEPWQQGTFENLGIGCFYIAIANKKLYAIACGQTTGTIYRPYSSNLKINVLDLETGTTTTTTIGCGSTLNSYTNYESVTGDPIPAGADYSLHAVNEFRGFNQLQVVDGSVFIPVFWGSYQYGGMTDCAIRVNLSDPNDQEIIKGFCDYASGNYSENIGQIDLGNGRVLNRCSMAWADHNGDYKGQLIDTAADVFPYYFKTSRGYTAKQATNNPVQFFTLACNADGVRGCILNKLYAATVYHLENTAVKTSNLTMTVEYTITQETGAES